MGGSHNNYYVVPLKVCGIMSLYSRLLKEKKRLGKFVLRAPRTTQELLDRRRWDRVMTILLRRYEFGMEDALDDMRRQDHFDEVKQLRR